MTNITPAQMAVLKSLSYPSDRITLGMIRHVFPTALDSLTDSAKSTRLFPGDANRLVETILFSEQILALCETHTHEHEVDHDVPIDIESIVNDLTTAYELIGLCTGPFEAAELVRRLRSEAKAKSTANERPKR